MKLSSNATCWMLLRSLWLFTIFAGKKIHLCQTGVIKSETVYVSYPSPWISVGPSIKSRIYLRLNICFFFKNSPLSYVIILRWLDTVDRYCTHNILYFGPRPIHGTAAKLPDSLTMIPAPSRPSRSASGLSVTRVTDPVGGGTAMAVGGTEYSRRRAASAPATPALSPASSPPGSPHRAPHR